MYLERYLKGQNKHKDALREMLAKVVQIALIRSLSDPFKSQTPQMSKLN